MKGGLLMYMFSPDNNKDNYQDDFAKERKCKDDECCVRINIFCKDCKKDNKCKEDDYKDDCKKEHERKDEKCCVCINIFCDDDKKEGKTKEDGCNEDYKKAVELNICLEKPDEYEKNDSEINKSTFINKLKLLHEKMLDDVYNLSGNKATMNDFINSLDFYLRLYGIDKGFSDLQTHNN
jgi:hypothetical protein